MSAALVMYHGLDLVFVSCRSNKHAVFELKSQIIQYYLKKCENQVYSSIKIQI